MSLTFHSYADVQNALGQLVANNQLPIGQAPHGAFFQNLSYQEFTTGNVPGVTGGPDDGGYTILTVGNSAQSNIILALEGASGTVFDPNSGSIGQMPQPSPPYNSSQPTQSDIIAALKAWIDKGCPQFGTHAEAKTAHGGGGHGGGGGHSGGGGYGGGSGGAHAR